MATYSSKKYPSGSVTSAQLADGTVVAVDLADGAVTSAKLNSTVDLSGKTVTYRSIVAGDIASGAITTAKITDANITPAKMANSGAELGSRNRIINGDMRIDQRYAGTVYTSTNSNLYTLDRWGTLESGGTTGKFTVQQNAGAVTPPVGFSNYMGITSLSAFSVTSGIIQSISQKIEGFNTSDLDWGTANAKTITISFWVRSSLTGTFGGVAGNAAFNYSYPFTYTISSANTWEYKSVTIAGPTAGTWVGATNGIGLALQFVIGTGTTYQGAAGSWSANGYYGVTGAVNVTGTSGATFYITGVQLEKGSTATPFENRPFGQEFSLCQRYFSTSFPIGTKPVQNSGLYTWRGTHTVSGYGTFYTFSYPVPMRIAATTITGYNGGAANNLFRSWPAAQDITTLGIAQESTTTFTAQAYAGPGDYPANPIGWNWSSSAEL